MSRTAVGLPDVQIISTLWRQLGWPHFKELLSLNNAGAGL